MIGIKIGQVIAWCAVPKQVLVHVQSALKVRQTQLHPIALLNKDNIKQFKEVEAEGVDGRYLEK